MEDKLATAVLGRWDQLKSARMVYEPLWNDVQKLVRVHSTSLYSRTEGDDRYAGIYDSTAPKALEQLGAGLHSYLTNPAERFFGLSIEGMEETQDDPQSMAWLEKVSDIIFAVYSNEQTNFNSSLHEGYLDIGAFGHCVVYQGADDESLLVFKTYPVADCWTDDNYRGFVDTLFRKCLMTGRQIIQEFGEDVSSDFKKVENQAKEFTILHAVYPRNDRNIMMVNASNKPFASVYVCVELKMRIKESGYDTFPYHVPRWMKLSNEKYGRSPAMECLPDIRMLNRMELVTIKAGQKQVDPPIVVPDDGFMLPLRTHPGALIFKEPNAGDLQVLEFKGNLPWAEDKAKQKREAIERAFHSDWLRMEKENQEMTAYEVQDRRDEKLRLLSPSLGRLQGELLGPLIQRTYSILQARGKFPPAPANIQRKKLRLIYLSPAARAQRGSIASGIGRLLTDIAPIMQMDPTVVDAINMDETVTQLAIARGTTRKIIRSKDEIAQLRDSRGKQQQMQQLANVAEPASKAALNLAKAKEAGGGSGLL